MRAGHDAYQPSCLTACHETDDNDSFSDTSDSNPSKEGVVTSDEAEVEIAVKESKEVRQVRCFLFIVLFLSLIGAVLVYLYFYWSEERNFEEEYLCQAERVS